MHIDVVQRDEIRIYRFFFRTKINVAPLILGLQKCYSTFWKALAMGSTDLRLTRRKKHLRMVVGVIQKKVKFRQFFL